MGSAIGATATEELLVWAFIIQSPADATKLGKEVWDRFGVLMELMQYLPRKVLKDEDLVYD